MQRDPGQEGRRASELRQTLRLRLESGLSLRECSRVLGIGKSTIADIVRKARAAGVDWAVAESLTDEQLEARLYQPAVPRAARHLEPDFAYIHQELKRPGVTLQLLWEEYCIKYRAFAASLKCSMRQVHIGGDKLFVDYAGQTVPIVNPTTGEITQAQIFVATLGTSSYTYACATATQNAADWVGSIIDALEFFGGVTRLSAAQVALKYKQLWTVEAIFRTMKSQLDTRPIFHKTDDTIRGHVFCSFLALLLRKARQDRLEVKGNGDIEWAHVPDDLNDLKELELTVQGKGYRLRTETRGTLSAVFTACGVALPPQLQPM